MSISGNQLNQWNKQATCSTTLTPSLIWRVKQTFNSPGRPKCPTTAISSGTIALKIIIDSNSRRTHWRRQTFNVVEQANVAITTWRRVLPTVIMGCHSMGRIGRTWSTRQMRDVEVEATSRRFQHRRATLARGVGRAHAVVTTQQAHRRGNRTSLIRDSLNSHSNIWARTRGRGTVVSSSSLIHWLFRPIFMHQRMIFPISKLFLYTTVCGSEFNAFGRKIAGKLLANNQNLNCFLWKSSSLPNWQWAESISLAFPSKCRNK